MRTLLFGGSFNPIHNGHIGLLQWTLKRDLADEAWLLVSPQNPLKAQQNLLDEQTRLSLAKLAVKGERNIKVSDFEFFLPRPSYTWNTLQALQKAFPKRNFSLLIGADNWLSFEHWAHHEDILLHHHIYVYPRLSYGVAIATLPPNVTFLSDAPIYPYSSTSIRAAIATDQDITDKVPSQLLPLIFSVYR